MRRFLGQLSRFGLVGLVGLVVDLSIFNLLRFTVLSPEVLDHGPLLAKTISVAVAIAVNWLGNRYWTFRAERRPHLLREGLEFAVVSVGGMAIALACLWVSHYVLGYTSALADNISANVIGLGLGTAFRFWLYRTWVFPESGSSASGSPASGSSASGSSASGKVSDLPTIASRPERLTVGPHAAPRSD